MVVLQHPLAAELTLIILRLEGQLKVSTLNCLGLSTCAHSHAPRLFCTSRAYCSMCDFASALILLKDRNETMCAHAYKFRKWYPTQQIATASVNLKLGRCWVVVELHAVLCWAVFRIAFGHLMCLADHKRLALKKKAGHLNSVFVVKLYCFCYVLHVSAIPT